MVGKVYSKTVLSKQGTRSSKAMLPLILTKECRCDILHSRLLVPVAHICTLFARWRLTYSNNGHRWQTMSWEGIWHSELAP